MTSGTQRRVLVLGGYGVFGSIIVHELVRRGIPVTVAGRDLRRAQSLADRCGSSCAAEYANVVEPESLSKAFAGHGVVVHCAGPYLAEDVSVLKHCLEQHIDYVDLSDNCRHAASVRDWHQRFARVGVAAVYGCSSLPTISLALAQYAQQKFTIDSGSVARVRMTLFIGQDNPKGPSAVRSAVNLVGQPIETPQGTRLGFRDREIVPLPPPFGRRTVLNFESPDYELVPRLFPKAQVCVKLGFESRLVMTSFAIFAKLAPALGRRVLPRLAAMSGPLRRFGCSGGAIMAELFVSDGPRRCAALVGPREGQRMAALPAVYVAEQLANESLEQRSGGVSCGCDFLGADRLLHRMVGDGFQLFEFQIE